MSTSIRAVPASLLLALCMAVSGPPAEAARPAGTLERYQELRNLSGDLERLASRVQQNAGDDVRERRSGAAGMLTAVRSFRSAARAFHLRTVNYREAAWNVAADFDDLERRAAAAEDTIRQSRLSPPLAAAWTSARDVLERMRQIVHPGPPAPAPPPAAAPAARSNAMATAELATFRNLTVELDDRVSRVHALAETLTPRYGEKGTRHLATLHTFNDETRALRAQAAANAVDPRTIRPIVAKLLADARSTESALHRAHVFDEVWPEWAKVIGSLQSMEQMLRSS